MAEEQLELDCYHKAEEGEPKFTLLARDPLAPFMVAIWAAFRKGDTASAIVLFADAVADPAYKYRNGHADNVGKLNSAKHIVAQMVEWRKVKGLETFTVHTV